MSKPWYGCAFAVASVAWQAWQPPWTPCLLSLSPFILPVRVFSLVPGCSCHGITNPWPEQQIRSLPVPCRSLPPPAYPYFPLLHCALFRTRRVPFFAPDHSANTCIAYNTSHYTVWGSHLLTYSFIHFLSDLFTQVPNLETFILEIDIYISHSQKL